MEVPLNSCNSLLEVHVTESTIKGITQTSGGWASKEMFKCSTDTLRAAFGAQ